MLDAIRNGVETIRNTDAFHDVKIYSAHINDFVPGSHVSDGAPRTVDLSSQSHTPPAARPATAH